MNVWAARVIPKSGGITGIIQKGSCEVSYQLPYTNIYLAN